MAAIAREFDSNVEKSGIFQAIKRCMPCSGFNMKVDQTSVWVDDQNKHQEKIIKVYSEHGLVLAQLGPSAALPALCPSSRVAIHEGMAVYYAGFSEDEGTYMCHKGRISSITSSDQLFTIDGATTSISPGSPVFTYDKVTRVVQLTGVIGKSHDSTIRAVHIDCFRQGIKTIDELGETRGGIEIGQFKGKEVGRGGKGPRGIEISGPASGTYNLTFISGAGKPQNPHGDDNYNNGGHQRFYTLALQAFIRHYDEHHAVPAQFEFVFDKTTYTATKE